jgi:hypothetical protein
MRAMRHLLTGLAIVGVLVLVGCSTASPSPSGSDSPGPSAVAAPAADCRAIDLMSPSGERVDLTGTWQGGVMVHHVRQTGDCVSWIGYGTWPGTEFGEIGTLVFLGRLAPDFSVRGQFTWIVGLVNPNNAYGLPGQGRHLEFEVVFDDAGNATRLVRDAPPAVEPSGFEYYDELNYVGPLPEPVAPPQQ